MPYCRSTLACGARLISVAGLLCVASETVLRADEPLVMYPDAVDDAVARPMDPGAIGSAQARIDLYETRVGRWAPVAPADDLFTGIHAQDGEFLRLDLILGGRVNPPGEVDSDGCQPFAFGDRPVFGFVEIDMDGDVSTGGELYAPEYRYLGNVARFGGRPARPEFFDRVALSEVAFDGDFLTPPFVERHGEEFHLSLLEDEIEDDHIEHVVSDGDGLFEAGETWNLDVHLFHRAHGFEPFSVATGNEYPGEYVPDGTVQFRHDAAADVTFVTLVFPLTNVGAGQMVDEPPEPLDGDASNQASVLEALTDLQASAAVLELFPSGLPEQAIIDAWANRVPSDYLDPTQWEITVLVGSCSGESGAAGLNFTWNDVWPNVVRGDIDGDGQADGLDRQLITEYLALNDANDGQVDGTAVISASEGFSIFDIDQNGVVNGLDILLAGVPGDTDDDQDVDLRDAQRLQMCFTGSDSTYTDATCALLESDIDGDIDAGDTTRFVAGFEGPGG